MLEVLSVDKAITSILENDIELKAMFPDDEVKLFASAANEEQSNGFWITFQLFDNIDTNGVGAVHIMSRPTYLIKVCNRDKGYQASGPMCSRINDLLTKEQHGAIDGIWVGKFIRTSVIRDIDYLKDMRNFWIGMMFDLIAYEVQ